MHELIARLEGTELKTRGCDALKTRAWESTWHRGRRGPPGTPRSDRASWKVSGAACLGNRAKQQKSSPPSQRAASNTRRDRLIRKNIMGHSTRVVRRMNGLRFAGLRGVLNARRAFALLHEPSREHGGGVLVEPRIEQLANLLAEIGGVAEPRQLVALQRGKRSRQEKLPGRFSLFDGHEYLLKESCGHCNALVKHVNSTPELRAVEICGNSARCETGVQKGAGALRGVSGESRSGVQAGELRACSACAGDYEDPDRTAWPADEEKSDAEENEGDDEFPEAAS